MPQALSTPRKDPESTVQEAGWVPGLVWTGVENLVPTGIWSLECPARSQSPYPLSYLGPNRNEYQEYFLGCKYGQYIGLTTFPNFLCRLSLNMGASTSWYPQGLSRHVMGLLYLYLYIIKKLLSVMVWCHTNIQVCWKMTVLNGT
jgi:hypothetical protein